jgi:adenylylsulfate kinase-like enzyme
MYGQGIDQFESILDEYGIPHDPELKFITEAEHVHSSSDEAIEELDQLKYRLGIDFE